MKNGLGVVDCSWKEVEKTPLNKVRAPEHRLLPYLVAGTFKFILFLFFLSKFGELRKALSLKLR